MSVDFEVTAVALPVTGRIPAELEGRYLRNALDGDGTVHGVRIRGGRADWYRSRWIRSPTVAARIREPHWKLDPCSGELHLVGYHPADKQVLHTVIDRAGRPIRLWRIDVGEPLVMHDFALTERYLVIYDQQRVGVMRRAGGLVRWLPVRPSVVSHTLNAYDDDRTITIHLVRSPTTGVGMPRLDRWTIDLTRGRVREERIDDRPQEYPRMNEVYVASGASDREDGGYLLSYVHNPERNASDLVVLSAEDFGARPMARVHLPAPIPLGPRSAWIPDH